MTTWVVADYPTKEKTKVTDLLTEPIFRTDQGALTLPGLLAGLSQRTALRLSGLRAHQAYSVHSTLVTLAALALNRGGVDRAPSTEDTWRELLSALTEGHPTAWSCLVEDPSTPAFLQPPLKGALMQAWLDKSCLESQLKYTADDIDVYNTAANHAPKARSMTHSELDHWVYALMTLQTSSAPLSWCHFGSSRTGGRGRFFAGVRSSDFSTGQWFVRDLRALLSQVEQITSNYSYNLKGQHLLWLSPWGGLRDEGLETKKLHPFYIDCARSIRLVKAVHGSGYAARALAPSKATGKTGARVLPSSGNTGDLWMPIQLKGKNKAVVGFEPRSQGIRYDSVHRILWGEDEEIISRPHSTIVRTEDGETPILYISALVLERVLKTKTEGFHERIIPIPQVVSMYLQEDAKHEELAKRSAQMIEVVKEVEYLLRRSLSRLLNAKDGKDSRVLTLSDAFDQRVDTLFFDALFGFLDDPLWLRKWVDTVLSEGLEFLCQSVQTIPRMTRLKREAISMNTFEQQTQELRVEKGWETLMLVETNQDPSEPFKLAAQQMAAFIFHLEPAELARLRRVSVEVPIGEAAHRVLRIVKPILPEDPEAKHRAESQWLYLASLMAHAPKSNTQMGSLGTELHRLQFKEARLERFLRSDERGLNNRIREVVVQLEKTHRIHWGDIAILLLAPEEIANRTRKSIAKAYYTK